MRRKRDQSLPERIEKVRDRFIRWRATREKLSPIPDTLWKSAIQLTRHYSFYQVSKALKLDYSALKKRAQSRGALQRAQMDSAPVFFEMETGGISPLMSEWCVEIENPKGAKLKIHVKGKESLDLLALSQCFLGEGS